MATKFTTWISVLVQIKILWPLYYKFLTAFRMGKSKIQIKDGGQFKMCDVILLVCDVDN